MREPLAGGARAWCDERTTAGAESMCASLPMGCAATSGSCRPALALPPRSSSATKAISSQHGDASALSTGVARTSSSQQQSWLTRDSIISQANKVPACATRLLKTITAITSRLNTLILCCDQSTRCDGTRGPDAGDSGYTLDVDQGQERLGSSRMRAPHGRSGFRRGPFEGFKDPTRGTSPRRRAGPSKPA